MEGHLYLCSVCGHLVISESRPGLKWTDGHICRFSRVPFEEAMEPKNFEKNEKRKFAPDPRD